MAPHSSTFAWKIPWMEKPGRLQSMGSLETDTTEQLHFHFSLSCIGEGNGNPLQCSCLENPRDWVKIVCLPPWGGAHLMSPKSQSVQHVQSVGGREGQDSGLVYTSIQYSVYTTKYTLATSL